ncbi:type I glyceraldehyde-3-phosphate dehydrogenase [Porticoccaceae bacterium LTM1]|nr:type I glyceraldehyde-3-phosphate dehydrogenase [Porticoccaceae bacterium LTM1]
MRIAINGFGRIGRSVLRAIYESGRQGELQVVAINELADCKTAAHLLRFDSTHGRFQGEVSVANDVLTVNDDRIQMFHRENIDDLPWSDVGVDVVLECTGSFDDRATAEHHLVQGAKRVLFSQPAKPEVDATIVYGINESLLSAESLIVSGASCTTNCVVPVIKALHDTLGVEYGVITTIHSAMNDQPLIDAYHHTDLRKTRSAVQSIIPVDTGLARGIDRILPELTGRFEAQAMRVPTVNVSAIDLSVQLASDVDAKQLNQILKDAAEQQFRGVLGYTEEPLASCDFNHDSRSGIVDAGQTRVSGKRLAKVLIWFDNEWGYANRLLDVLGYWNTKI